MSAGGAHSKVSGGYILAHMSPETFILTIVAWFVFLRPETEAYTIHLASLLSSGGLLPQWPSATVTGDGSGARAIRILDLCTGTGCIPLLLASEVAGAAVTGGTAVHALGIDVSRKAVALARRNVLHNAAHLWPRDTAAAAARVDVGFLKADIFSPTFLPLVLRHLQDVDVLTANPPYISAAAYRSGTTARSVRRFEPALALVPSPTSALLVDFAERAGCRLDDVFYARLLDIFVSLCHSTASRPAKKTTRARVALFEVGDLDQAMRVSGMALRRVTAGTGLNADIEIWKDWPDCNDEGIDTVVVEGREIMIRGSGNGRSVLIRCSER